MPIMIHNKEYITVAERVTEAHKACKQIDITTEILSDDPVVIKATVKTEKGTFTGISAANPSKAIEKQSPYEVAETSAVGRALGFASFGAVEGIASADEMIKAEASEPTEKPQGHFRASDNQVKLIFALGKQLGKTSTETEDWVKKSLKIDSFKEMELSQASVIIEKLMRLQGTKNEEVVDVVDVNDPSLSKAFEDDSPF